MEKKFVFAMWDVQQEKRKKKRKIIFDIVFLLHSLDDVRRHDLEHIGHHNVVHQLTDLARSLCLPERKREKANLRLDAPFVR